MITKEIHWASWQPKERATLCFIIQNGKILLIRKKRGLGAGKINGPGGRIEIGESPLQAAIRETQEEVGVTPLDLDLCGELYFQFVDGFSLHCTVFLARNFTGELQETDEATPYWIAVNEIPFEEMWSDDAHWLPGMLRGGKFKGYFLFNEDKMLTKQVNWITGL
ncbi:MAG: 8-oxo-dGTP diphosphatase [Chthoniobacterales bacterium]